MMLGGAALITALGLGVPAEETLQKKGHDHGGPAPLSEAAARMLVPEGFGVELAAGEPDVRQPIAITIDPRGRLWVAECYSYPRWIKDGRGGRDRILILEDADGNGSLEKRKVFREGLANVSGIELGFGGAWVAAIPNLLFIPDRDGDDVPDGDPVAVLDGWSLDIEHNAPSSLRWGPDGWLHGGHGILATSLVGKPGAPREERTPINCGVWRYHPLRQEFEVVAWGTTNPWGLDFDDWGECFITNCVIPHLYHVVPGAHFERMFGEDFAPHLYDLMGSSADHLHWGGGAWQESRGGKGRHSEAGGGHAHAGAMIYLGDSWPEEHRNTIFMANIHGNRLNHDTLESKGSGYVARHRKDFLLARDEWFRGLELEYGPDGSVYMTDWSDTGECHENDAHGAHHESGRIYRIAYGDRKAPRVDLERAGDLELAELQLHRNDFHVRHARRILAERAAAGKDLAPARRRLEEIFVTHADPTRRLRALWALHGAGGVAESFLLDGLGQASEHVRAWSVRLLCEGKSPSDGALRKLEELARSDPSPRVRLYLASVLQRLALDRRRGIGEALALRAEDASDPAIPLLLWYGLEPLVPRDMEWAFDLALRSRIPLIREHIARRAVSHDEARGLEGALSLLDGEDTSSAAAEDVIEGLHAALRGRKSPAMPEAWSRVRDRLAASGTEGLRRRARLLGLILGDPKSVAELESIALDPARNTPAREDAIRALSERRVEGLGPKLLPLLDDPTVRGAALRALAAYGDPETARRILARYASLSAAEKADAVSTLASRPAWAGELLLAVEKGTVPARDVPPFSVRQIQSLGDAALTERLAALWGAVRPPGPEKASIIAKYRAALDAARLASADLANGRHVFAETCAPCHRLHGEGADVGPDLTGSQRANLDYVLENVIDPSASVGREYKLVTAITTDGRVLSGIIKERTEKSVTIQTVNERIAVPAEDIAMLEPSDVSMMPEGSLEKLTDAEVRDLVAYLRSDAPGSGGGAGGTQKR